MKQLKLYRVYLKERGVSFDYARRRVLLVKAETKKAAKEKCRKRKDEIVDGVDESNGCDCWQMWCPVCHG